MAIRFVDTISLTGLSRHLMVSLPTLKKYAKKAGIVYNPKTGLTVEEAEKLMLVTYENLGRKK